MLGFGALGQFALGEFSEFAAATATGSTETATGPGGLGGAKKGSRRKRGRARYDFDEGGDSRSPPVFETQEAETAPDQAAAAVAEGLPAAVVPSAKDVVSQRAPFTPQTYGIAEPPAFDQDLSAKRRRERIRLAELAAEEAARAAELQAIDLKRRQRNAALALLLLS